MQNKIFEYKPIQKVIEKPILQNIVKVKIGNKTIICTENHKFYTKKGWTKAKDLCSYVMTVTQKSPKHFRYTFVNKLQNLALSVIENLFRANDVYVSNQDIPAQKERLGFQRAAMTDLKLLGYMAMLSMEQECILPKQYEQIARQVTDCQNLLGAWMNSDRRRLQP